MRTGYILVAQKAVLALALFSICGFEAHTAETIQIKPGFAKLITFDRPVATVSVGNPAVADTTAQSDRAILLTGKTVGSTNILALDNAQKIVFDATVVVGSRGIGKVLINSRPQLHQYWAYRCTPACERVEDPLQSIERAAPAPSPDERTTLPPANGTQGAQ